MSKHVKAHTTSQKLIHIRLTIPFSSPTSAPVPGRRKPLKWMRPFATPIAARSAPANGCLDVVCRPFTPPWRSIMIYCFIVSNPQRGKRPGGPRAFSMCPCFRIAYRDETATHPARMILMKGSMNILKPENAKHFTKSITSCCFWPEC